MGKEDGLDGLAKNLLGIISRDEREKGDKIFLAQGGRAILVYKKKKRRGPWLSRNIKCRSRL